MTPLLPRKNTVIQLDFHDMEIVEAMTHRRVERAKRLGRGHGNPVRDWNKDGTYRHRVGCVTEMAFARMMGLDWPNDENDFGSRGDFDGIEVRGTCKAHGPLIIYRGDRLGDRVFVLMRVQNLRFGRVTYAGHIIGHDAERVGVEPFNGSPPPNTRHLLWVAQQNLR